MIFKITFTTCLICFLADIFAQTLPDQSAFSSRLVAKNFIHGNEISFVQNKGQIVDMNQKLRPDVLYKSSKTGTDIYLRKTGITYVYNNIKEITTAVNVETARLKKQGVVSANDDAKKKKELMNDQILKLHRVDMDFINCNSNVTVANENETGDYANYYYAHCPKGILNVKQYHEITFKNIYKDIDVTYYGDNTRELKYDILIKSHADPKEVKLNWHGADEIVVSEGKLKIKTSVNEFYESIPKVYQNINGKIVDVEAAYSVDSLAVTPAPAFTKDSGRTTKDYIVSFKLGTYNPEYSLIIDPVTWITYFGGTEEDLGATVTTDGAHNVIFDGYTESPDLPVSAGAFQAALSGFSDGFVTKFTAAGARVWATYIGGTGKDEARGGIVADGNNDIYFGGETWSTDFPTMVWAGAFMQPALKGGIDDYIAKISAAGVLLWSTYYGGTADEWAADVTLDAAGNILFTGQTQAVDFPTQAPYQAALKGLNDVFVVKFNNLGIRQWCSYYGGSNNDEPNGITTDAGNNIYVCGQTQSADFPIVGAAFQAVYAGGTDAFLFRLDPLTGNPAWSTFYGGAGSDDGTAVAADPLGNVFLGLETNSANNISTAGSYQPALKGNFDGAIIKFTTACARTWGTYIGGTQLDEITGLAIDYKNDIVAGGNTQSNNFPVTSCAFETTFGGARDMIMARFNEQGQLLCSTYINNSGTIDEAGGSIALDGTFAYMNGVSSGKLPVTAGAFQFNYAGVGALGDAAFIKLCSYSCGLDGSGITASFTSSPATICTNSPASFTITNSCDTSATTYSWSFTGATSGASVVQNPSGVIWNAIGSYGVSVIVMSPCDTVIISNTVIVKSCSLLAVNTSNTDVLCNGSVTGTATVTAVTGSANYTYTWSNGSSTTTTANSNTINGLAAGIYTVTITDGTSSTVTATVVITQPNAISLSAPVTTSSSCTSSTGSAVASASGGTGALTYTWSNGISGQTNSNISSGTYTVTVEDANSCTVSIIAIVGNIGGAAATMGIPTDVTCAGNSNGSLTVTITGGTSPYTYTWSDGTTGTTTATSLTENNLAANIYSITITDAGGCVTNSNGTINSPPAIIAAASASSPVCVPNTGTVSVIASGGKGAFIYSWSNGVIAETGITGLSTGTYTVTVTDANGCSATSTAIVSAGGTGIINITPATQIIAEGNSVAITVSGGTIYTWTPANGLSCTICSNPVANPTTSTTYTITTIDINGCPLTAMFTVTVRPACVGDDKDIFIANIFSPNGDGKNDILYIEGNGLNNIYWAIYDRWGNILFEAFDQMHGWDGTRNGNPLETGTYVYYLRATCIKTNTEVKMKGNVSIVK